MASANEDTVRLPGRRKAAILIAALGSEVAPDVYRSLTDEEIEQLTIELANLGTVPQEIISQVMEEFYHMAVAKQYVSSGGIHTAKDILEKALGSNRASEIISDLQGMLQGTPFDFLKKMEPQHLFNFIQHEHPQTIALILSYLEPEQSATLLSSLDRELQVEVALRIASMDQTAPEIVSEVERVLERKITKAGSQHLQTVGGFEAMVEMLNLLDGKSQKNLLDNIEEEDQQLASELKKHMFTFEHTISLDDRAIRELLSEIDMKDVALALKGADENVRRKIFENVSSRAAENIRDDMDVMGPVRVRDVENAQQKIVATIRRLEELGKIVISKGPDDDMVS